MKDNYDELSDFIFSNLTVNEVNKNTGEILLTNENLETELFHGVVKNRVIYHYNNIFTCRREINISTYDLTNGTDLLNSTFVSLEYVEGQWVFVCPEGLNFRECSNPNKTYGIQFRLYDNLNPCYSYHDYYGWHYPGRRLQNAGVPGMFLFKNKLNNYTLKNSFSLNMVSSFFEYNNHYYLKIQFNDKATNYGTNLTIDYRMIGFGNINKTSVYNLSTLTPEAPNGETYIIQVPDNIINYNLNVGMTIKFKNNNINLVSYIETKRNLQYSNVKNYIDTNLSEIKNKVFYNFDFNSNPVLKNKIILNDAYKVKHLNTDYLYLKLELLYSTTFDFKIIFESFKEMNIEVSEFSLDGINIKNFDIYLPAIFLNNPKEYSIFDIVPISIPRSSFDVFVGFNKEETEKLNNVIASIVEE